MADLAAEREIILGVLHSQEFLEKAVESGLHGKDFDKPIFSWIYRKAYAYFRHPEYGGRAPSKKILLRILSNDKYVDDETATRYARLIKALYKRKPDNLDFWFSELNKFTATSKFISHLATAAEAVEGHHNIDSVVDTLANNLQRLQTKKEAEWEESDYLDGFEERQRVRKEEAENPQSTLKLKFGIKELDRQIPRGVTPGMAVSMSAKTGVGKSISCVHVGKQALWQDLNVTHIITENALAQIEGRYDASFTGVMYDMMQMYNYGGKNKRFLIQAERNFHMLRNAVKTRLKIFKCTPNKTNVATLERILDHLEKDEGHETHVLLVDSPELMIPVSRFQEYRLQKAAVYWELKSLLLERKMIGFVTSQLKASTDDHPTPEDMSEAYDKARLLDLMLVLVRTTKQRLTGEASLSIVKARDSNMDGMPITLRPDFSRMLFDVR